MLGNLGELAKLMSKAKDIQNGMKNFRDELPKLEFSASGSGVKVTLSGDMQVKSLEITPDAPADREELARELTTVFNSAASAAKLTIQERMREMTGGLGINLPGLF